MTVSKTKILLAEDDKNLGLLLKESLELEGYEVDLFKDGEAAWKGFASSKYTICVLDIMMPVKDGLTLAKEIRSAEKQIPIIFLTAKSMKEDRIEGLKLGADDYITKPFSMEELALRIEAILRRVNRIQNELEQKTAFQVGQYSFDHVSRMLISDEKQQKLTTKEAALLRLLCLHENKLLEREVALKSVWGDDNYFTGRSMDVYVTKLRKYLKGDPSVEIQNVHGEGFRLIQHQQIK